MTIRDNMITLKAELEALPGPKPQLATWQEWLDDIITLLARVPPVPSSQDRRAQEAHERFLKEHPELRGGDAGGQKVSAQGAGGQGQDANNDARVQARPASLGQQAGSESAFAQAGDSDRAQPGPEGSGA